MRVFSFDIFDTLVTRMVISPKDVFHLLAECLTKFRFHFPSRLIDHFWAERVWAEFQACRNERTDALDIETIYLSLGERYELSTDQVAHLVQMEIEQENDVLVPIRGAVDLVEKAREQGQVVFLSDMYLPELFIGEKLEQMNIKIPGERIYVSGTRGVSKRSGLLYKLLLDDLNVGPDQVTHFGDNLHDDVSVPLRMGINVSRDFRGERDSSLKKKLLYAYELYLAFCELKKA